MIDFTGPQRVLEDPEPTVTGRRARHEADDPAAAPRSRRRVGWRKGSDVDEELWPVEAFGGVSDEQFWDDLATDKPLATTARAAQPNAARTTPPTAARTAQPDTARTTPPNAARTAQPDTGAQRRPPNTGSGTQPQPRLGPDDRTAIQPAQPGPQPSATLPIATQPVRAAHQPAESRGRSRASADEDPLTSPAYSLRPRGSVDGRAYASSRRSADLNRGQHEAAAGQETQAFSLADTQAAGGGYPDGVPPFRQCDRPSHGGNEGRGRPDAGRPDPLRSDGYRSDPLRSDPLRPDLFRPGDGYGGTSPSSPSGPYAPSSPYPYPQQPYGGEPAQPMNTPPYGERYGYGNPADQGGPAGDPRRANGGWSPGQTGGNGGGTWGSRPAYPPVNGPRGPYDPRGYDRRLTSLPRPGAHQERYADQRGFA